VSPRLGQGSTIVGWAVIGVRSLISDDGLSLPEDRDSLCHCQLGVRSIDDGLCTIRLVYPLPS